MAEEHTKWWDLVDPLEPRKKKRFMRDKDDEKEDEEAKTETETKKEGEEKDSAEKANKEVPQKLPKERIAELMKEGKEALERYYGTKDGAKGWLGKVLMKGTSGDRTAALTVLVQENPVRNLEALRSLTQLAHKKSRTEAKSAIEALKALYLQCLLPPFRPLYYFFEQPELGHAGAKGRHLALWYFEDCVKRCFVDFVGALEAVAHDPIGTQKDYVVHAAYELLRATAGHPDPRLIAVLVNKLGDQSRQVCGRVTDWLTEITQTDRRAKAPIVEEVERFLYRRNNSTRAQFYAVVFLSSLRTGRHESALATQLVTVYLSFFRRIVAPGKELDSRLLSALMTGVHRAFPFSDPANVSFLEHTDGLFLVARTASFNKSMQALQLLYEFMTASQTVSDRFYAAFYERMLAPDVFESNKLSLFFNLLYRAIKADPSPSRAAAFVKRLLQVACYAPPPFACAALFLVSEVFRDSKQLRALVGTTRPDNSRKFASAANDDDDDDDDDEDIGEGTVGTAASSGGMPAARLPAAELRKLARQCDVDPSGGRPPPNVVAAQEALRSKNKNRKGKGKKGDDEDDEKVKKEEGAPGSAQDAAAYARAMAESEMVYRPMKRNPLFTNADKSSLWELVALVGMYHPSVQIFAESVLRGKPIEYSGNPLLNFTLSNFLDRFAFKNPKARFTKGTGADSEANADGEAGTDATDADRRQSLRDRRAEQTQLLDFAHGRNVRSADLLQPVNARENMRRPAAAVPADERFFHEYFRLKGMLDMTPAERRRLHAEQRGGRAKSGVELDEEEYAREAAAAEAAAQRQRVRRERERARAAEKGEDGSDDDDDNALFASDYEGLEDALAEDEDALDEGGDFEESFDDEDLEDEEMAALSDNADALSDGDDAYDDSYATGDLGGGGAVDAEDDSDGGSRRKGAHGKKRLRSKVDVFGDAEDFEDLVDREKVSDKQAAWEEGRIPTRRQRVRARAAAEAKAKKNKPAKKRARR